MFRTLFSKSHEPSDVARIRAESLVLRQLRTRFTAVFEGARCLIIGSAPEIVIPGPLQNDRHICVNGSPYVAKQGGIDTPDLTVITGDATALKNDHSRATVPIWKGLQTRDQLFIETGDRARHARSVLDDVGFRYERFLAISKWERAAIIGEVCGVELGIGNYDERVSNGVFGAILALWCNASDVVLCGFSFRDGHSYIRAELPRQHVKGDHSFFDCADRLGFPISTTSVEIHEARGVRLVA
jgi:hypothetical protein